MQVPTNTNKRATDKRQPSRITVEKDTLLKLSNCLLVIHRHQIGMNKARREALALLTKMLSED